MFAYERRNEIKRILRDKQSISVSELAGRFFVSESTIRRDLDMMSANGEIHRTYGGAILVDSLSVDMPITIRERENIDAKNSIARSAVNFIHSGATVILDTSSTVTAMVPLLGEFDALTVITNSIKTAYMLNACSKITTYCTGGRLRGFNMSLVGATAVERLSEINADIAFISCRGMTPEKGITEASDEEAQVKRAMIEAASRTVLLCDSSKHGLVMMNRICQIGRLHAIVSDRNMSHEYISAIESVGVKVVISSDA